MLKSLNQLRRFREALVDARRSLISKNEGVIFDGHVRISLSSRFISGERGSIVIGDQTLVAFKTLITSWDDLAGVVRPVRIGRRCFIGGGSMILPGVTIGDGCIVGGGAVVFADVPGGSIVGGNPARVIRSDIVVGPWGQLEVAKENSRRLWKL